MQYAPHQGRYRRLRQGHSLLTLTCPNCATNHPVKDGGGVGGWRDCPRGQRREQTIIQRPKGENEGEDDEDETDDDDEPVLSSPTTEERGDLWVMKSGRESSR